MASDGFVYPPATIPNQQPNVEYTHTEPPSPDTHFAPGPYSTTQGNNLSLPSTSAPGANSPVVSADNVSERSADGGSWNEQEGESPKMTSSTSGGQDGTKQESSGEGAASENPENVKPRKQKLRFPGDTYTPAWVRYTGHQKEGFCEQCPKPGRWLQLKNSAYWYHKQFFHGISSVSGQYFTQPLDLRVVFISTPPNAPADGSGGNPPPPVTNIMIEGLCHQCRTWVALMNAKRRGSIPSGSLAPPSGLAASHLSATTIAETDPVTGATKVLAKRHPSGSFALPNGQGTIPAPIAQEISDIYKLRGMTVLWFRHAHKCHVYHKPKAPPNSVGQAPPGHGGPPTGPSLMPTGGPSGSSDQYNGYNQTGYQNHNASTPYGDIIHPHPIASTPYGTSYHGMSSMSGTAGSMMGRRASHHDFGGLVGMPPEYGMGYQAGSGPGGAGGMMPSMQTTISQQQGGPPPHSPALPTGSQQQQQQQQQHHMNSSQQGRGHHLQQHGNGGQGSMQQQHQNRFGPPGPGSYM
ncbi:hypothetical protein HDV00_004046 [Rhizophlyctis rosea]|nr:hypothetical protein HDV00_004046 [Rhizophlyctis rosea]